MIVSELADHELTARRLEKLRSMRSAGVDPYPRRFDPDASAAELAGRFGDLGPGESTGVEVTVAGRLLGLRDMGNLRFGVLQDASGRIQLFVDRRALGPAFDEFGELDLGDWVGARGEVMTTKKGELSVKVQEFRLLSKALRPFPEKFHGLKDQEQRYRRRYLDLIVNERTRETFRIRSVVLQSLRETFVARGFVEVETPLLQAQPGGATAKPFVTHHDALGIDMFLRVAPELYLKRLIVGGLGRVFELGPTFRNEGLSPRHNPEFTMLEAYQAFADFTDMMELTEVAISTACKAAIGTTEVVFEDEPLSFGRPFPRLDYLDAIEQHAGERIDFLTGREELASKAASFGIDVEDGWGPGRLIAEIFETTTEPHIWQPTIVYGHPTEVSPLARTREGDPNVTDRFEIIAAGREIANAFTEINDPLEQRERFEAQAAARAAGDEEAHPIDEDYLVALEYGMPPTGGLGIGVDRLVMLVSGQSTIREVLLFPHLRPRSGQVDG